MRGTRGRSDDQRRPFANRIVAAILLASLFAASNAVAQEESERFQLQTLDYQNRATSVFGVASGRLLRHLEPSTDVVVEYVDDPLRATIYKGTSPVEEIAIVDDRLTIDLGVAVGLLERVQLEVRTSAIVWQVGQSLIYDFQNRLRPFAFGDVRLGATYGLFASDSALPYRVALQGRVWLPTGALQGFASDGVARFEPRLVFDTKIGETSLLANAGYQFRGERIAHSFRSDDVVRWGLATRRSIAAGFGLDASIFGAHSPFSGRDHEDPSVPAPNAYGHPVEGMVGLSWAYQGLVAMIGGGRGLTKGVGAPRLRLNFTLAYRPAGEDDAWVPGRTEEGTAGAAGAAGGPSDGVTRGEDQCPLEEEDVDGFEDEDGCPDHDNDGDGIADFEDACALEPGIPEKAGCPASDRDADGIDDAVDACSEEPEDLDEFDDEDGCPDPDNDGDGLADTADACPNEAETINGNEDDDGCPDEGKSLVSVRGDRIEILQRVYFDTGRATIKQRSWAVLEQVAAVMKNRPEIRRLAIEGHTDSDGSDATNLDLSRRRARAVREFLESRGVDSGRLVHRGYGESHPIESNADEEGRARNRRVEFLIVDQRGEGAR